MDDTTIIKKLLNGDEEAYKIMFQKYYAPLFNYAHTFVQNVNDAEDIIQTCFLNICNRPTLWKNIVDLRGYLYSMVRKQSLYQLRSRKSTNLKENSYIYYHLTAMPNQVPEALLTIEQRESGSRIDGLLSVLSPQRCKIFKLVYFDRKSYQQAAEILGISRETVKTQLALAKTILRGKLGIFIYLAGISLLI